MSVVSIDNKKTIIKQFSDKLVFMLLLHATQHRIKQLFVQWIDTLLNIGNIGFQIDWLLHTVTTFVDCTRTNDIILFRVSTTTFDKPSPALRNWIDSFVTSGNFIRIHSVVIDHKTFTGRRNKRSHRAAKIMRSNSVTYERSICSFHSEPECTIGQVETKGLGET